MGDGWRELVIGKKQRGQEELFLYCRLGDLVPDEHILKRVGRIIDLSSDSMVSPQSRPLSSPRPPPLGNDTSGFCMLRRRGRMPRT
ncbi:MAG TPA: hypothetical protein PL033_11980 [Candidatus Brocadiia bacterium]|nr:hypothetical protein [Candidatus Brocadiia bacterium]